MVDQLVARYPTDVRFVFKQFPLNFHANAHLAAEAALAAHAQGRFWPYHDLLFAHQSALARADLEGYATQIGLDLTAFRAALDNHTDAAAVDADVHQGESLGVAGTPAFFFNGRLVTGAVPYDDLVAAVEEAKKRGMPVARDR